MTPPDPTTPPIRLHCDGKQAFMTKGAALRAFSRQRARRSYRNDERAKLNVYRCPDCNTFHIGSQPRLTKPRNLRS